jgi:hypothetical protein
METPDIPETLILKPQHMTALVLFGTAALLGVFTVLAVVRLWASRMQKKSGACSGLDLEALRKMRDTGQITQEEYEAVRGTVSGAPPPSERGKRERSAAPPETPIDPDGRGAPSSPA